MCAQVFRPRMRLGNCGASAVLRSGEGCCMALGSPTRCSLMLSLVPCMYVLYVCLICMPCMHALYACFICMPCMHALYVCLICMPYRYALCVCVTCVPTLCSLMVYVCLICMPYMYALYACLICMPYAFCVCVTFVPTCSLILSLVLVSLFVSLLLPLFLSPCLSLAFSLLHTYVHIHMYTHTHTHTHTHVAGATRMCRAHLYAYVSKETYLHSKRDLPKHSNIQIETHLSAAGAAKRYRGSSEDTPAPQVRMYGMRIRHTHMAYL